MEEKFLEEKKYIALIRFYYNGTTIDELKKYFKSRWNTNLSDDVCSEMCAWINETRKHLSMEQTKELRIDHRLTSNIQKSIIDYARSKGYVIKKGSARHKPMNLTGFRIEDHVSNCEVGHNFDLTKKEVLRYLSEQPDIDKSKLYRNAQNR